MYKVYKWADEISLDQTIAYIIYHDNGQHLILNPKRDLHIDDQNSCIHYYKCMTYDEFTKREIIYWDILGEYNTISDIIVNHPEIMMYN